MSWWRRIIVAVTAAATLFFVTLFSSASAQTPRPASRDALVQRAADALARGDAPSALRDYEAAAAQEHAADIELGIVRSLMLGGHYRRALAFAAHTAQAHPADRDGARLYAQLLDVGGHSALAARVRPAGDTVRVVPAAATGVLIDAGRHALLPLHALRAGTAIELRDGAGRRFVAQVVQRNEALGLALLRLEMPQADAPRLTWAARDAFAGSPAHTVTSTADEPPWPRLHSGFIGTQQALGIDLAGGAGGGAVWNGAGRVIGLSLTTNDAAPRLIAVSALRQWLGGLLNEDADAAVPQATLDAIYETALRATVALVRASP